MPYAVQARLRAQCDETVSDGGEGLMMSQLATTCNVAIPRAQVAQAITAIRSAPGLEQDLTGALTDLDSKLLNFAKIDSAAHEMRVMLEKAP
jgi:hypothetical protein